MTARVGGPAWYVESGQERQWARIDKVDSVSFVAVQLADATHRHMVRWYDAKPKMVPAGISYAYAAVAGDTFSLDDLEEQIRAAKRLPQRDDSHDPSDNGGDDGA